MRTDPRLCQPIETVEQWDDFLEGRYKKGKSENESLMTKQIKESKCNLKLK
jgi:hypothetical protein